MLISINKTPLYFALFILVLALPGCKKDSQSEKEYAVNPLNTYPPNAGKSKQKTDQQYVSILHANLFQKALSANQIFEISQCIESIGDKELAREVIISNFMNETDVIMPSDSVMRADLDFFLTETYRRFLVREPTEAEKTWFKNYIEANPNVTVEMVYFSFSLTNEYLFY